MKGANLLKKESGYGDNGRHGDVDADQRQLATAQAPPQTLGDQEARFR